MGHSGSRSQRVRGDRARHAWLAAPGHLRARDLVAGAFRVVIHVPGPESEPPAAGDARADPRATTARGVAVTVAVGSSPIAEQPAGRRAVTLVCISARQFERSARWEQGIKVHLEEATQRVVYRACSGLNVVIVHAAREYSLA